MLSILSGGQESIFYRKTKYPGVSEACPSVELFEMGAAVVQ